ncbi:hypothetical protein T484DRAFT_1818726 [Baffinella frigidus]|nr:hypothetical protein T484DRAFT_1818726 [Cryptophyta sp. CCMP2293]
MAKSIFVHTTSQRHRAWLGWKERVEQARPMKIKSALIIKMRARFQGLAVQHTVALWADLARTKKRLKRKTEIVKRSYAAIVLRRFVSAWVLHQRQACRLKRLRTHILRVVAGSFFHTWFKAAMMRMRASRLRKHLNGEVVELVEKVRKVKRRRESARAEEFMRNARLMEAAFHYWTREASFSVLHRRAQEVREYLTATQSRMVNRVVDFARVRFRRWRLAFFHWRLIAAVSYEAARFQQTALKIILARTTRFYFRKWEMHYAAASREEQHTLRSVNAAAAIP